MLISKFIDYLQFEKSFSKHTLTAYKKDLESFQNFLQETFSDTNLLRVNYVQIRTWIVHLVNKGISNNSINRKISSLKSFYKFLEKIQAIKLNPLQGHRSLKTPKKSTTPFSKNELNQIEELFNQVPQDIETTRDHLIIELLYTTGIRRSELIGIKHADINIQTKTLKVLGKRNKERFIPLLDISIALIQEYVLLKKELGFDSEMLFITNKGKPVYASLIYKIVNKYFSTVSTKDKKSPHVLRHAFATHLLDEGADLNTVKDLLGHASLASTQIYTQTSLSHLKKVYNKAHPRNK